MGGGIYFLLFCVDKRGESNKEEKNKFWAWWKTRPKLYDGGTASAAAVDTNGPTHIRAGINELTSV